MSDSRRGAGGPRSAEDHRQRAEEQFKVKAKSNPRPMTAETSAREAEIAKTARLRALRLAKEEADKEAAAAEAANKAAIKAAMAKAARSKPRSSAKPVPAA
jgi:multidrug efflux pump subunit AcrA (membrane-fusion protein)